MSRAGVLNMALIVVATGFGLWMAFYEPKRDTARHTVDEYRANVDLRREVFRRCTGDPGTLGKSPDCINAREAERLESHGSLREQPALGLDPASR